MIKSGNTDWYAQTQPSFTSSVEEFLSGKVFGRFGTHADTPVVMNLGQRQIVWGMDEIEKLSQTLFSELHHDPDHLAHTLDVARNGGSIYQNASGSMPPMLNELCIQPSQEDEIPKHLDVIDGQQRSFAMRTIVAWALVRGSQKNPTGAMDPALFHLLMRPRAGRADGHDWIQRVDFDQGLAENDTWTDERKRPHGAMGYLLGALSRGPDSIGEAAAKDMTSRLDRDIRARVGKSSQATAIHQVFKYMDGLLRTLSEQSDDGTQGEIIDALAMSMLQAVVNVRVLHPNINAEQYLRNQNTTGVGMSDSDSLKTLLVETSAKDEMVVRNTNRLKLLADQNAKGNSTDDLKLLTYMVALALSTKSLGPLGLVSTTKKVQPYIERLLLDHPKDAAKTAKAIAKHLPGAFEAVLLLRTKRGNAELCSSLPRAAREAMHLHAKLGVRGFTPILAWMALTNPTEVHKAARFVNQTNAHNYIVSTMLPSLEGRAPDRKGTERMDRAAIKWAAKNQAGQEVGTYLESVKNLIIEGVRPAAFAANEDVLGTLSKLARPGAGERSLLMAGKNGTVMNMADSAALQTILGVTQEEIVRGVDLVVGPTVLGTFIGQTQGVTIAKKPMHINVAQRDVIKQVEALRKGIWDAVGGEPERHNIKTRAQQAVEEQRQQQRTGSIWRLLEQARKDGFQEASISTLKTQAGMLAAGIVDDNVFQYICVQRGRVDKFYKGHFHKKSAKEQMKIVRAEIPGVVIPTGRGGKQPGNQTTEKKPRTP